MYNREYWQTRYGRERLKKKEKIATEIRCPIQLGPMENNSIFLKVATLRIPVLAFVLIILAFLHYMISNLR